MALIPLLIADAIDLLLGSVNQWGLFLDGAPVIVADQVTAFRFRKEYELLSYPVEQGAFETYNKVAKPFTPTLRVATGGSVADKEAFLDSIDAIVGDLNLYDVVTPEVIYSSVNVEGYNYDRTAVRGVGLLAVDILLKEVRVTGTLNFTNTQTPSGANTTSSGTVQPQSPTALQTASIPSLQ